MLTKLALAGALALALSVPAVACEMTVDEATALMTKAGVTFQIVDDPDAVKAMADVVAQIGYDATGAVRALIGDFGSHYGVGFEGADGCLTPQPIPVGKAPAASTDRSQFGPLKSPSAPEEASLLDMQRDYREFRELAAL